MKIDRLIGILSMLLQKDTVTAPYLAEQFEVSRRTINRDIEDLCKAGIPIVTKQGIHGGISIMENYKISKTLLSNMEMQDILAGLRSLDSVNGTNQYKLLMEKLSAGSSDFLAGDQSILIDLSSWYKDSLAPKIQIIRNAVDTCHEIAFYYYSPSGESQRTMEPYYLIFHWSSWYIWGWCKLRKDFRLFKLNRMEKLEITEAIFKKRQVSLPDLSNERIFPGKIHVKALFTPDCKWRLVEEFGTGCYDEQPDGKLLFHTDYTNKEELITWIMTFRDHALLLEPESIRQELQETLKKTLQQYKEDNSFMIESRCGLRCNECDFRTTMGCNGCVNIEKPFWADSCPVKSCCEEKGYQHCGECESFVCPLLHTFAYDMEQSDNGARIEQCRKWKEE